MPFATEPKARPSGTGRGCRAVVAAGMLEPGSEWAVFRALQLANFTGSLYLDDTESIREALRDVPGVDADAIVDRLDDAGRRRGVRAPARRGALGGGHAGRGAGQDGDVRRRRALHGAVRRVPSRRRERLRGRLAAAALVRHRPRELRAGARARPAARDAVAAVRVLPGRPDDGRGRAAPRVRLGSRPGPGRGRPHARRAGRRGSRHARSRRAATRSGVELPPSLAEQVLPKRFLRFDRMLVEDRTAFIEQLEVQRDDRRAEKRRRRRRQCRGRGAPSGDGSGASRRRRSRSWRRSSRRSRIRPTPAPVGGCSSPGVDGCSQHRIESMRARCERRRAEAVGGTRVGFGELDRSLTRERPPAGAKVFRLHSAQHHLECSETRFARLASSQTDLPVLVAGRTGGAGGGTSIGSGGTRTGLDAQRGQGHRARRGPEAEAARGERSCERASACSARSRRAVDARDRSRRSCASPSGAATAAAASTAARRRTSASTTSSRRRTAARGRRGTSSFAATRVVSNERTTRSVHA